MRNVPESTAIFDGLVLRYTADELKAHFLKRSVRHKELADQKEKDLPAFCEGLKKMRSGTALDAAMTAAISNYSGKFSHAHFDPDQIKRELEEDIKEHRKKAVRFNHYAEHVFTACTYGLSPGELETYELLS